MSLYDDLGVEPEAPADEIQRAYREKAKQHHPDRGGDRETFERINRAALVLRDPARRARYDSTGETDSEPDNHLALLMSMLHSLLEKALHQAAGNFERVDLVALMKRDASAQLRALELEIDKGQKALKRTDKMIGRIRFAGDGPNLLERILLDRRGNLANQIRDLEKSRDGFNAVIERLEGYGWAVDEDPQMALGRWPHATSATNGF